MQKLLLAFVLFIACSSVGYSQVQAQESRLLTGRGSGTHSFADQDNDWYKAKKVAFDQASISKKPPRQSDSIDPEQLLTGSTGMVQYWEFSVVNVIDEKTMILKLGKSKKYCLIGYPTKGFADGEALHICEPVEALEPRRFTSKQDVNYTLKVLQIRSPEEKKQQEEAKILEAIREYNLKDGTKIKAAFSKYTKNTVVLLTEEKKELQIPLADFDADSSKAIRDQIKKRGKPTK